jgi:hypothetical protein
MSLITAVEISLWVAGVVMLTLGFMFPRSRLGRGRWMAAGVVVWVPGQVLSTLAEYHRLSYAEQNAVAYVESIGDLAFVLCAFIVLIQLARPKSGSRASRAGSAGGGHRGRGG